MITLLIADDHDLVRMGLERILNDCSDIKVIDSAKDGEEAVKKAREHEPDVILMDLNMPGIGGIEATRKVLRHNPDAKILIVTALKEEPFPSRLLKIGASGYITKDSGADELTQAIRAIHTGMRYINPVIAQKLALQHLNNEQGESALDELSDRELEVMLMITKGVKVADIAEKLHISPKTVNSYRYRLFEKLEINNDVEMTYLAIRHGMVKIDQVLDDIIGKNNKTETGMKASNFQSKFDNVTELRPLNKPNDDQE
jgi:two-component system invasion response regulator UvrY